MFVFYQHDRLHDHVFGLCILVGRLVQDVVQVVLRQPQTKRMRFRRQTLTALLCSKKLLGDHLSLNRSLRVGGKDQLASLRI